MTNSSYAWQPRGSTSLWRYAENERNYPGWHLSADRAGSESLTELIDAFASMSVAAVRTLELDCPSAAVLAVPNNKGGTAAIDAALKLRVRYVEQPSRWQLSMTRDAAELEVGHEWLARLRSGCVDMANGRGDYSIGTHPGLWFWWQTR
jgi:hypothetical protein